MKKGGEKKTGEPKQLKRGVSRLSKNNNQENIWQLAGVVILGVIALALVYNVFFPNRSGAGFNVFFNSGGGLSLTTLITGILVLILKVLKVLLVIGLIAGSVLAAKKYLLNDEKLDFSFFPKEGINNTLCPSCGALLNGEYNVCPNCKTAVRCSCGKELQIGWKLCPYCGTLQEQNTDMNRLTETEG